MEHISLRLFAILFTVVALILGMRRLSRLGFGGNDLSQLMRELRRQLPVYSAETIQGREAEFIRERLRERFPLLLVLVAVLVFAAFAWWLVR